MWIYHAERPTEVITRPPFLVVKAVAALHPCIVSFEPKYMIALSMLRLVHEASRRANNIQLLVFMLTLVRVCTCNSASGRYTTSRILASTVLHEGSTTCEYEREWPETICYHLVNGSTMKRSQEILHDESNRVTFQANTHKHLF